MLGFHQDGTIVPVHCPHKICGTAWVSEMFQSAHLVGPGRRGIDEFRLRPKVHATKLHLVKLLYNVDSNSHLMAFDDKLFLCKSAPAPGLPSWCFICALTRGTGRRTSDSSTAFKMRMV